jgi:hypothetical protein
MTRRLRSRFIGHWQKKETSRHRSGSDTFMRSVLVYSVIGWHLQGGIAKPPIRVINRQRHH